MFEPIDNQRYASLANTRYDNPYSGNQNGIVYGITHLIHNFFNKIASSNKPCVLVTSFSDSSVTKEQARKLPSNVIRWFSNNVEVESPKIEAIPIGFVYNFVRTNILMEYVKRCPMERDNLVYVCFLRQIPRTPNPREGLYEMFGGKSWVTCKGGSAITSVSPKEFYNDISKHHYVLSPAGAGLDCHRTWEAMALGSIPIVLRSIATQLLLEDMPCLLVSSWDEVTQERLEAELPRLKSRFSSDAMRKLDMGYWRKRIVGSYKGAFL